MTTPSSFSQKFSTASAAERRSIACARRIRPCRAGANWPIRRLFRPRSGAVSTLWVRMNRMGTTCGVFTGSTMPTAGAARRCRATWCCRGAHRHQGTDRRPARPALPLDRRSQGARRLCLLVPRLVTGRFDPKQDRAIWPSTGNYCRGGVAISRILGCRGVAVLPAGMSRERFDWLQEWVTDPADIIRTPGTESNVKEIYDKCAELARRPG